jgi:CHAD domain-containing protein
MIEINKCFNRTVTKYYKDYIRFESKFVNTLSVEDLHQMRVALRRLRAAIKVFRSCLCPDFFNELKKNLKYLAPVLGAVRDVDITLLSLRDYKEKNTESIFLDDLISQYEAKQQEAKKQLLAFFDSAEYLKVKKQLLQLTKNAAFNLENNVQDTSTKHFYKKLKRVILDVFKFERHFEDGYSAKDLHSLRIAVKYLRYNIEFVAIQEEYALNIINLFKILQEQLGKINDRRSVCKRMLKMLKQKGLSDESISVITLFIKENKALNKKEAASIVFPWKSINKKELVAFYIPEQYR